MVAKCCFILFECKAFYTTWDNIKAIAAALCNSYLDKSIYILFTKLKHLYQNISKHPLFTNPLMDRKFHLFMKKTNNFTNEILIRIACTVYISRVIPFKMRSHQSIVVHFIYHNAVTIQIKQ